MNKPLFALLLLALVAGHGGATAGDAAWVTHASRPGPENAAVGQSRFDDLFRDADGEYRIPYPFGDLLAQLDSMLDNGRHSGVRQVLIPHGRSLQRAAAAPGFFRYPRVVAALQGEPRGAASMPQRVLEYRLFIAHQPASQSLEIISYNDSAGRFEFQVVDDYRADGEMRVRPANRRMCLGCHQNAGPIFARRPWSETNFNFRVARRLAETHPDRYESFVAALGSDADALDLLTDRANYLAAAQLIWQRGCDRVTCRAAVLRALLQYRLSDSTGFERNHSGYAHDYLERLRGNWQRQWPHGLALADSRIADRDPFDTALPRQDQDPLAQRPPHAVWDRFDRVFADGVVFRLAGFLTRRDIRRLDRFLVEAHQPGASPSRRLTSRCRLAHEGRQTRLLECSGAAGPRARLELEFRDGQLHSLHLLSLRMTGNPKILQPETAPPQPLPDGVIVELRNGAGHSMRLTNGERLQSLQLQWQDADLRAESRMTLVLERDFAPIDRALQTLVRQHRNGTAHSLGDGPFRRQAILADLERTLGTTLLSNAGERGYARPPAHDRLRASGFNFAPADADLFLLQAHCGQCHGRDQRQPPGFLAGSDVERRIVQCAPRILARLHAWQSALPDRIVPMPPPVSSATDWPEGEHYARLLAAVERLLEPDAARPPTDGDRAAYDALDACLGPG